MDQVVQDVNGTYTHGRQITHRYTLKVNLGYLLRLCIDLKSPRHG